MKSRLLLLSAAALLLPAVSALNPGRPAASTEGPVSEAWVARSPGGAAQDIAGPLPTCNVSGTITTNTTWSPTCVYVPSGVTVGLGATLTIEPGVVVKLGNYQTFRVAGTLVADGTPAAPIYFTSLRDDSVGGDTNGDGPSTGAAGDWGHIYVYSGDPNVGASATFDYVTVRYGGWNPATIDCGCYIGTVTNTFWQNWPPRTDTDGRASVSFTNGTIANTSSDGILVSRGPAASLIVTGSTFASNAGRGVMAGNWGTLPAPTVTLTDSLVQSNGADGGLMEVNSSSVITGNTFSSNGGVGLSLSGANVTSSTFNGNGSHGLSLSGGNVTNSTFNNNNAYAASVNFTGGSAVPLFANNAGGGNRYNAIALTATFTQDSILPYLPDFPYVLSGSVGFGATLTIEPGVIIKNYGGLGVAGSIVAHGTTSAPIYFTSLKDDSVGGDTNGDGPSTGAAGDWGHIYVYSGDPNVGAFATFDYVTVRYGGWNPATIDCGCYIGTVTNTFWQNWPPRTDIDQNASIEFTNGQLQNNAGNGLFYNGTRTVEVTNSILTGNTGSAVTAEWGGTAVDARNNYWGAANGPSNNGQGCNTATGSGDKVGCNVFFDPWLTSDPGDVPGLTPSPVACKILAVDMWNVWDTESLDEIGRFDYDLVSPDAFQSIDLNQYDLLYVPSAFRDSNVTIPAQESLNALNARSGSIDAFVSAGGGLVALSQPIGIGRFTWAPVSATPSSVVHNETVLIADPLHPVNHGLTNSALSNWVSSSHHFFSAVDSPFSVISTNGDGAAMSIVASYGLGRIFMTGQDPDFHTVEPDGSSAPDAGAETLLNNAITWACGTGSPADSDSDGISDATDNCPGTPLSAIVDSNGCSQAQVDQDMDSFCDPEKASTLCKGKDVCPLAAEDIDGFEDNDGCPELGGGPPVTSPETEEAVAIIRAIISYTNQVCQIQRCPGLSQTIVGKAISLVGKAGTIWNLGTVLGLIPQLSQDLDSLQEAITTYGKQSPQAQTAAHQLCITVQQVHRALVNVIPGLILFIPVPPCNQAST